MYDTINSIPEEMRHGLDSHAKVKHHKGVAEKVVVMVYNDGIVDQSIVYNFNEKDVCTHSRLMTTVNK